MSNHEGLAIGHSMAEVAAERKPLADDEFISMLDSAGLVVDPELAFEIKEMVEAAHGITGEEK